MTSFEPTDGGSPSRNSSLICLLLVAALAAASGCGVHRQPPSAVTAAKIRQIHGALLEFRTREGQLPDSLEIVCRRDARLCELTSFNEWRLDGWGRRLSYVRSDGYFELRSAGADGVNETDDDLWFSSQVERHRVGMVAGCYRMPLSWWKQLSGDLVTLDTVPLGSGYRLLPDAGPYIGRWVPEGVDSLRLSWVRGDQSITLLLRHQMDSLIGRDVQKGRPVVGVKIGCP